MVQEGKVRSVEKYLLHKSTSIVINKAPNGCQRHQCCTVRVIFLVGIVSFWLTRKATRGFLAYCTVEAPELKHQKSKNVRQYHEQFKQECEMFSVDWDKVCKVQILALNIAAAKELFIPSIYSNHSALQVIFRGEI